MSLAPLFDIISSTNSKREEIVQSGLQLLVRVYGGLNHLRYTSYLNMISTSTFPPRPERLPPTENSAKFHILRTHHQVIQWNTLMAIDKDPTDWGWKLADGHCMAIASDQDAAPSELLKIIRCKCNISDKRQPCLSQLCTCFKHGLPCVAACKHCCGESYANVSSSSNEMLGTDNEGDEMEEDLDNFRAPYDCLATDIPWIEEEEVIGEDMPEIILPWVPWMDEEVVSTSN